MDGKRLRFGLISAFIGLLSGIFVGRKQNQSELKTLRQIIRQNQERNFEAMQQKRSRRDDETT